jgi:hypothetical protein
VIQIRIISFPGLKGVEFGYHHTGVEDGIAIRFPLVMEQFFSEGHAFKSVDKLIRQSELDWIEPGPERWTVDLDRLKVVASFLAELDWLRGNAKVKPELQVEQLPGDLSGLMPPSPPQGGVILFIRPENLAEIDSLSQSSGGNAMSSTIDITAAPKAFASYSWEDEEHKTWVRSLAVRLSDCPISRTSWV